MSSTKVALISAAGATALYLASKAFTSSSASAPIDTANLSPDECIQPDDVIAIFDDLFLHMQSVLAQLSQQIQQIQMAGQSIPEAQLRKILKSEFERALLAKQAEVFDKHDVDEDCLKEATWEFLDQEEQYPKVKKAVERFQTLYENVTGEKTVGKRPGGKGVVKDVKDISKEQLLEAAGVYFNALTTAMGTIVTKFKDDGKDLTNPIVANQLQMEFAGVANESGEKALAEIDIDMDSFKAAVEKYQSDPEVGRTLALLQMKQQQELMALGVPTM